MELNRLLRNIVRQDNKCNILYSLLYLFIIVPLMTAANECIFNRTYSISASAIGLNDLIESRENGTALEIDREAFLIESHWGADKNKSAFIEETSITDAIIVIEFPATLPEVEHGLSMTIGDNTVLSFSYAQVLDETSTLSSESNIQQSAASCAGNCTQTFDIIDVVQVWLAGTDFIIFANNESQLIDAGVELGATLRIVLEDLVQETEFCSRDQFQCNDGRCLEVARVCDAIEDCLHKDDESRCGSFPVGSVCNFEGGSCGWRSRDSFWLRNSGPTPTRYTGPMNDHTLGTSSGYYIYTEATNMRSERAFSASIVSPSFDPLMANGTEHCKVTFFYHMRGEGIASLRLFAVGEGVDRSSRLFNKRQIGDNWNKVETVISSSFLKGLGSNRYHLEFEGTIAGNKHYRGDMAIDDISMSPECFGIDIGSLVTRNYDCSKMVSPIVTTTHLTTINTRRNVNYLLQGITHDSSTAGSSDKRYLPHVNFTKAADATQFSFTSCGQIGSTGPTQEQCNNYYASSNVSVSVRDGYQKWTVPISGLYRITAMGARGGTGVQNPGPSYGAVIQAVVNLTRGQELYILIGQAGYSACSQTRYSVVTMHNYCTGKFDEANLRRFGDETAGGGGGGGGGTYVTLDDAGLSEGSSMWQERLVPLVIAGGGGGLSFSPSNIPAHGSFDLGGSGTGQSGSHGGDTATNLAGAGGGWYGNGLNKTNGQAFVFGGRGGTGCLLARSELRWNVPGGFGGGGGGCTSGGGGGGFTGGNGSFRDSLTENGAGGSSYVSDLSLWSSGHEGKVNEHGKVAIEIVIMCKNGSFVLKGPDACDDPLIPLWGWLVIMTVLMVTFIFLLVLLLCRIGVKKSDEDRLRKELALLRNNVMSEINPLYGARKSMKEEDFPELPRSSLRLLHPLGNGAFGEVYKGVYYACPDKTESMSVAVKTLSKDATDEHKHDFLMEAVIMGSLKHKNIVKLVGVSFIRVPKFLILEFMDGGELKTFLQNNRPSYSKQSKLKMLDLLKIATDVADGCKYLESLLFIHRDLAARNILLTTRGPGRVAKIGDFGMAKDIYKSNHYRKSRNALVPVKWMPPEAYLDGIFTTKTDVWAFGILLWEILTFCYIPYPGLSNHEVIQCVARGERMYPPRYCPQPLKDVMTSCWRKDPEHRPSFEYLSELLGHLCTVHEVISVPIPYQGIEIERGLMISCIEADKDINENSPMLARRSHFTTDSEGYLQADYESKPVKSKRTNLGKIKVDFPKNVEMNIYDSELSTTPSTANHNGVSGTPNDLGHEYSFPPGGSSKRYIERTDSLV